MLSVPQKKWHTLSWNMAVLASWLTNNQLPHHFFSTINLHHDASRQTD
jgi:hypothetical protein